MSPMGRRTIHIPTGNHGRAAIIGVGLALFSTALAAPGEIPSSDAPKQEYRPPQLIERISATYPKEAEQAGLTGTVVLEFDVDPDGKVQNATVKTAAGHGFDEAALDAVRRFVFAPGTLDGRA